MIKDTSSHTPGIRAIMFGSGETKKETAARRKRIAKANKMPSLKDIRRSRKKYTKLKRQSTMTWIFRRGEKDG